MNTKPEDIILVREFKKLFNKVSPLCSFVLTFVLLCGSRNSFLPQRTLSRVLGITKVNKGFYRQLQFFKILDFLNK